MPISTALRELVARDPNLVLNTSDLQELDAKFSALDVDGDGEITRIELRRSLANTHAAPFVTESRVDSFLRDMDLDGDGCLTFEELTSATAVRRCEALLDQIEREIVILDPNRSAGDTVLADALLEPLLEAIGLYETAARATALARVERDANGGVQPEHLALAVFAVKRG